MAKTIPNGFLLVFDGIDGVGKSTQLELAAQTLRQAGWDVVTARNLGGTPIGEELRKVIKAPIARPPETDLYISAAIQAALVEEVTKLRAEGKLILMDRGPLSLAAYEIFGSGGSAERSWPHVDYGMESLKPELTIIYTADTETALKRAKQHSTGPDYFESKPPEYFDKVADGYRQAASRYDGVVFLDANGDIGAIHGKTMALIEQVLPKPS
ncbi:MAG TPA: dTMP kinase [Candidatus Saccharimonadia bacterium]|nr:dTMP kinase [Candidatus Saccharimonadia bacterium]